jgi:hypothetical protein
MYSLPLAQAWKINALAVFKTIPAISYKVQRRLVY